MNRSPLGHLPGMTSGERLAISRQAIFNSMTRRSCEGRGPRPDGAGEGFEPRRAGSLRRLWQALRRTTMVWWRSHPAHLAAEVVQPVLGQYARTHPLAMLGVAAALGAVVVLARPWRLIPVTGVLMAALKSKVFSNFIASVLMPDSGQERRPQ